MKISLSWIKEFTDIKLSDEEIIEKIASQIAEIENVVDLSERYRNIVVAKIIEANDHPDADKLGIYKLDIGKDEVQVVAGDKTLQVDDMVAYLPPGARIPSSFDDVGEAFEIKKVELRGQESNGMLGSSKELAFSDVHEGVLVLDEAVDPGTPLSDVYALDDKIIEVENKALTHRPDCFGVIGFAREVAGIADIAFKSPDWLTSEATKKGQGLQLKVIDEAPDACLRFTAQAYSNVQIGYSPIMIQSLLSRVGIRPINNVVDITNYMMVMTGQPFHAFDYDKVSKLSSGEGVTLVVRYPKEGEKITLLDGREIEPHPEAAMVATDKALLSVGGAMGGADTEVDADTTNIIMEAASWDLYSIRTTSMKHGIFTEAVTRFARGQDPNMCLPAQTQAAMLLEEYAGATVASNLEDDYPTPRKASGLSVEIKAINMLLGLDQSSVEMARRLSNVELDVLENGAHLDIIAPTWRADIEIQEDIAEEIGRLTGYDKVPTTLPFRTLEPAELTTEQILERSIRSTLQSAGANEQLSYNFISEQMASSSGYNLDNLYKLRNAISPELLYLRPALLPSIISRMYPNHRQGYGEIAMFEINKTHSKDDIGEDGLPNERQRLALVFSADNKTYDSNYMGAAFYHAKFYLEHLLMVLGASLSLSVDEKSENYSELGAVLHDKRRSEIVVNGKSVGTIGEFSDQIHSANKLPLNSAGFELDLDALASALEKESPYKVLSKYPATSHDVTLKVASDASFGDIENSISDGFEDKDLSVAIEGIDVYQDEKDQNTKNLTYRINLVHAQRTLATKEVNQMIDQMVSDVCKKYSASRV